jgi:hypothetical protein
MYIIQYNWFIGSKISWWLQKKKCRMSTSGLSIYNGVYTGLINAKLHTRIS